MRRHRQNGNLEGLLSIDSLIDIVSNMVGILVIIGVISSLNLSSKNYIYETPLAAATEKNGVLFECAGDRLIPVTYDSSRHYNHIYAAYREVLIPKSPKVGEARWEIERENSDFRKALTRMDSSQQFISLYVRPNGFETFRAVRKLAWENGFEVGWIPKPQFERIVFSPFGTAVGEINK